MGLRTHLFNFHQKHGRLVDFAGFEMPESYEGIIPEHLAVRNEVGMFDVTHMGRCVVEGTDAAIFLNYILTRDLVSASVGQGRYSVMCNERGGIIDDLVVFRLGEEQFLLVYNASNRKKDYAWVIDHARSFQSQITDISDEVVMFAVQGPKAVNALQSIADTDLSGIRYYRGSWMTLGEEEVFVSRTGYTGEDGFEIFLWDTPLAKSERAERLWQTILEAGQEFGIKPCGLGARDTLRIEAGMCLYGNDIDENTTPVEAGMDFVVQFEKEDFIGKEALLKQKAEGVRRVLVGIRALERGIPRAGGKIISQGKEIGQLTSGTFSPLLRYGIGMGYVPPEYAQIGTRVDVLTRKTPFHAEIVNMPFYDTARYGRRRHSI